MFYKKPNTTPFTMELCLYAVRTNPSAGVTGATGATGAALPNVTLLLPLVAAGASTIVSSCNWMETSFHRVQTASSTGKRISKLEVFLSSGVVSSC